MTEGSHHAECWKRHWRGLPKFEGVVLASCVSAERAGTGRSVTGAIEIRPGGPSITIVKYVSPTPPATRHFRNLVIVKLHYM